MKNAFLYDVASRGCVRTDVSEERIASVFSAEIISDL
jgi:hypothetical protein